MLRRGVYGAVKGNVYPLQISFLSVEQVGGSSGVDDTDSLTLNFSVDPVGLSVSDITITGATKGTLTGTGTTRNLTISNITVENGETVSVAISDSESFIITGSPQTAVVYLDTRTEVNFLSVEQVGGSSGTVDSTAIELTFDVDPITLSSSNISITGATKGTLSGTGLTREIAISDITVNDGETVSVFISNPTGYNILGSPQTAVVYKDTTADFPFVTEWTTTEADTEIFLPLVNSASYEYDMTVDWGDGSPTSSVTSATDPNRFHTYSSPGVYEVSITGKCDAWSVNNQFPTRTLITGVIHWGGGTIFEGFKSLLNGFYFCTLLSSLPENESIKIKSEHILTCFGGTFQYCYSLQSVDSQLFSKAPLIETFQGTFLNCTGLLSVPSNLFEKNVLATNFSNTFRGCRNLQLNSSIFGTDTANRFLNQSVNFNGCFYRDSFTGVQGTAPELWNFDFGTGTPSTSNCFGGSGNSTTSLTNYNDIPTAWKTP